MSESQVWASAVSLATATAENYAPGTPERAGAEAVAKAIYRATRTRGFTVMAPAWVRRP